MQTIPIDPPIVFNNINLVKWIENHTYESDTGATYYSGENEPSLIDAISCLDIKRYIPVPPVPRTITKLTLKSRFDDLGKWTDFKDACISMNVWDDFLMAQDIRTDNSLFTTASPLLKATLNLTDEQFDALLA